MEWQLAQFVWVLLLMPESRVRCIKSLHVHVHVKIKIAENDIRVVGRHLWRTSGPIECGELCKP